MQVIGIGCLCWGGGEERKIIYISQNILPQSVHSFTFPGFLAEYPLQSEKKKNTAQHKPLFIAHIGEEGGWLPRKTSCSVSERSAGSEGRCNPARFDVRTSHCLSTSESKWGKVNRAYHFESHLKFSHRRTVMPLPFFRFIHSF